MIVMDRINDFYPANNSAKINRELGRLLVYLDAPGAVARTIELLESAPTQEEQIHYAFLLRDRIGKASPELQARYFNWFKQVRHFRGGTQ